MPKHDFPAADWIWSDLSQPAPMNRFTYFRKVVTLNELPKDATLLFAADTTAQLFINGHPVRRKVTRYAEEHINGEIIEAGPYLRQGENVVLALHHNWGDIVIFMRTGNRHAGLYCSGDWLKTGSDWKWMQAPQFLEHDKRIIGIAGGTPRIRYPVVMDGAQIPQGLHEPGYDVSGWASAQVVAEGPWPRQPIPVETTGQREYLVEPFKVLGAGTLAQAPTLDEDVYSISRGIKNADLKKNEFLTARANRLVSGETLTLEGKQGRSFYLTFDFGFPVHGFPVLDVTDSAGGVVIDLGYGEIQRSLYDLAVHVDESGWVNTEGVVGKGYADRYICRQGEQRVEFPEERTARWLALHFHFRQDTTLELRLPGFIKSQYPISLLGSFDCGDERTNQIVKLCLIHSEVTMSDAYIDTPGREDGQWIEDIRPRALLSERWYGDNSLRRLLIRHHAEGQLPNGNLHPFAPSNFPMAAPYDWSVQWVAALHDEYMWTGSTDLIEKYWPVLESYWTHVLSMVDESGLWITQHVLADIRVGVRPTSPTHSSGIVTPWIIQRLRWSAEMAEAVGKPEQARQWRERAEEMAEAFRKHHVIPAADDVPAHVGDVYDKENPESPRGYSQAGQTVAILAELLTPEEAAADVDYAFPAPEGTPPEGITRWNNPTYAYRVLTVMSQTGRTERAVQHLLERYAPYLPHHPRNDTPLALQGPYGGPLPEYWISHEDRGLKPGEINTAQPDDDTGSHGWGAVPLLWMHETLLGIRYPEPGGQELVIAPDNGGLPYVNGHSMTPKGLVWVSYEPQRWRFEVRLPDGVDATLVLPAAMAEHAERCRIAEGAAQKAGDGRYTASGSQTVVLEIV